MDIYDITLPMRTNLACWPGDTPYQFGWTARRTAGSSVNVGQLTMSVHTGTHTDAPFHFDDGGPTVELLPLEPYIGRARVVDVRGRRLIGRDAVESLDLASTPRVLFRTDAWTDHSRFPAVIPVMDTGLPQWLHQQGVRLVGVDLPSVDAIDSKDLPVHHALGACGIAILESLDLGSVPAGVYELVALPLKIAGADGAPVRAILRTRS